MIRVKFEPSCIVDLKYNPSVSFAWPWQFMKDFASSK